MDTSSGISRLKSSLIMTKTGQTDRQSPVDRRVGEKKDSRPTGIRRNSFCPTGYEAKDNTITAPIKNMLFVLIVKNI